MLIIAGKTVCCGSYAVAFQGLEGNYQTNRDGLVMYVPCCLACAFIRAPPMPPRAPESPIESPIESPLVLPWPPCFHTCA